MTLDEAIKHCENVAAKCFMERSARNHSGKCGFEYLDLAAWLRELKAYKEQEPCEDCISRDIAIANIQELAEWHTGDAFNADRVVRCLKSLQSVQPKPIECEDAISRSETIKYLNTNMAWYDEDGEMADSDEKLKAITDLVNGVPSAHPKTGKWIQVSERLPELDDDGYSTHVLVSFSNFTLPCIGQIRKTDGETHWYEGDDEKALDSFGLHVNAWMPLPKPYKTESEGKE